jgi:hypothetical protein
MDENQKALKEKMMAMLETNTGANNEKVEVL